MVVIVVSFFITRILFEIVGKHLENERKQPRRTTTKKLEQTSRIKDQTRNRCPQTIFAPLGLIRDTKGFPDKWFEELIKPRSRNIEVQNISTQNIRNTIRKCKNMSRRRI